MVDQFFSTTGPGHRWSHTSFIAPPEVDLSALEQDNTFLVALDGDALVGHVAIGDVQYTIHGGGLTSGQGAGTDWFHAAMTYTSGAWRIYLDGAQVAQRTDVTGLILDGTANLTWGRIDEPYSQHFPGGISDVRIYNKALTGGQIADTKTMGTGGLPADPTMLLHPGNQGIWPVNEGSGSVVEGHGTDSVKLCYKPGAGTCSGLTHGAPVVNLG